MGALEMFLRVLEDPATAAPVPLGGGAFDDAMRQLFVQVACSDGVVQEAEFSVLERLLPGMSPGEVLEWVADAASNPPAFEALAALAPDEASRRGVLEFAVRVAWADRHLAARERQLLARLTEDLVLPAAALDETLARIIGRGRPVGPGEVTTALGSMAWKVPADAELALPSDISAVVPASERLIARLVVDGVAQVALFNGGFAARFTEGPAFVPWDEVRHYTRVPTLGASVAVSDHDGHSFSLNDARLQEVAVLLDRLYGAPT